MCGRFTFNLPPELLIELFSLAGLDEEPSARFNVAPTQTVAAVVREGEGNRLRTMRWGLVPFWAKEVGKGAPLINARSESAADKAPFRQPVRKRRCLIPASGFYEWRAEGKVKVPHYLRLKGGAPMALAGIWDVWRKGEDELYSCAILTTEANPLVAELHDRMPVIVPPAEFAAWLDPQLCEPAELARFFAPYPDQEMELYRVSGRVNSAKEQGEDLVLPFEDARPAELFFEG